MNRLIRVHTVAILLFYVRLKLLFASVVKSNFRDGRVHVRNLMITGFKTRYFDGNENTFKEDNSRSKSIPFRVVFFFRRDFCTEKQTGSHKCCFLIKIISLREKVHIQRQYCQNCFTDVLKRSLPYKKKYLLSLRANAFILWKNPFQEGFEQKCKSQKLSPLSYWQKCTKCFQSL